MFLYHLRAKLDSEGFPSSQNQFFKSFLPRLVSSRWETLRQHLDIQEGKTSPGEINVCLCHQPEIIPLNLMCISVFATVAESVGFKMFSPTNLDSNRHYWM
ncbi:hypothetical protein E3U43_011136 [Larimichthys crocea]|uniref:Uncharacterized protein n=1 Tax=Larimichthys crocea TaxID=215358 RepID=A0ACD3QKJ4_LARCR|nr:hypothetical protein E3U43_011136 [Larimichthys crocea]